MRSRAAMLNRLSPRSFKTLLILAQGGSGSSAVVVPLVARDTPLGAIVCCAARRQFEPADLALIENLAGRAATALDNAQLFQTIRDGERRKDEFLAMLGHELRNPLAAITNAGELTKLLEPGEATFDEIARNHSPASVADETPGRRSARCFPHHQRSRSIAEVASGCGRNRHACRRSQRCFVFVSRAHASFGSAARRDHAGSRPLSAGANPFEPVGKRG